MKVSPDYTIEYSSGTDTVEIYLGDQHKGKTTTENQALLQEAVRNAVVLVKAHKVSKRVFLNKDRSAAVDETNERVLRSKINRSDSRVQARKCWAAIIMFSDSKSASFFRSTNNGQPHTPESGTESDSFPKSNP